MELAYISHDEAGMSDRLLADLAAGLEEEGWPLAGAVQINTAHPEGHRHHMDLRLLGPDAPSPVRISEDLGPGARGCRLDLPAFEAAAGLAQALYGQAAPRLLIVNKFGKREVDGGGFRPLIAEALGDGVPVIVAVGRGCMDGFGAFAEGLATPLTPDAAAMRDWCLAAAD